MTKTAMIKERNEIWNEYRANCKVFDHIWGEVVKCEGHGMFEPTGQYELKQVLVREMTMEEWDSEKAKRYKTLNEELKQYEEERRKKARIKRYKEELPNLRSRLAYIEKYLAENDKQGLTKSTSSDII